MQIKINSSLNFNRLRQQLGESKRLRIEHFLESQSAAYVAHHLKNYTPWHLVHSDPQGLPVRYNNQQLRLLSEHDQQQINQQLNVRAAEHYQYKYKFFPIIDEIKAGRLAPDSMLFNVANFLNSSEFIAFSRSLTGASSLVKMDPQASLYEPGDFLTMHDDSNYQRQAEDQSSRRFAVVLGMTEKWSANWGGQTSFFETTDSVESLSWAPGYNVLTIFEVPAQHSVGYVTPFATSGRYSITGWLRDDPTISRPDLGDRPP